MSYVNSGRWIVGQLRQVAVDSEGNRIPTGAIKPNVPSDPDYVAPIDNSESQAACPVPTTTTTTTTTTSTSTTTTTTLTPPVPCDTGASYSGGEAFPSIQTISLGTDLGTVVLNFDALSVPDKFEVWFDGVKVIDTGYRGDISLQSNLNSALAARGLPPETIVGTGAGSDFFEKSTATTTAEVRVYAPISGTAWSFVLGCPTSTTTTTTLVPTGYIQVIVDNLISDGEIVSITGSGLPSGLNPVNQVSGPPTQYGFTGTVIAQTLSIEIVNPSAHPDTKIAIYYSSDGTTEHTPVTVSGIYDIPLTKDIVSPEYVRISLILLA